jgi:molybdopterin converting factor small subunit
LLFGGNYLQVKVRVYGGLESSISGTKSGLTISVRITWELSGRMLLEKLNVPEDRVFSFLVNGVYKYYEGILSDGDRIAIFPGMCGR